MRLTRRGNIVTTVLTIPALLGIGVLSVDGSQAYVARTQLQSAVDLSARSGAGLLDGTAGGMALAVEAAVQVSQSNHVLGGEIHKDAADVLTGFWTDDDADPSFVPSSDPEVVDALLVTASTDVPMIFADSLLGIETIPVSSQAVSVNLPGGASSVDCVLPLALPDCVLDDNPIEVLQDFEFTLSPAGLDNVGWASPADSGNPSAAWVRSQLLDCELSGDIRVGDELWLNNGLESVSLTALARLLQDSTTRWDTDVYGTLPEQMSNSAVRESSYGNVVEGVIMVFEGNEDYCSGNGTWDERDMPVTGMVWGAFYDVSTLGGGEDKNIKVRLDLEREHQVGDDQGGGDYSVVASDPILVR